METPEFQKMLAQKDASVFPSVMLFEGEEAYTSHNTNRLDVDGVVEKILTTDYVKEELEGRPHLVEA